MRALPSRRRARAVAVVRPPCLSVRILVTVNLTHALLISTDPRMFSGMVCLEYPDLTQHPEPSVELLRTWWQLSLAFLKSP